MKQPSKAANKDSTLILFMQMMRRNNSTLIFHYIKKSYIFKFKPWHTLTSLYSLSSTHDSNCLWSSCISYKISNQLQRSIKNQTWYKWTATEPHSQHVTVWLWATARLGLSSVANHNKKIPICPYFLNLPYNFHFEIVQFMYITGNFLFTYILHPWN